MSGAAVTPDKEAEMYESCPVFKTDLKIPAGDAGLKRFQEQFTEAFLLGAKGATESLTTGCLEVPGYQ